MTTLVDIQVGSFSARQGSKRQGQGRGRTQSCPASTDERPQNRAHWIITSRSTPIVEASCSRRQWRRARRNLPNRTSISIAGVAAGSRCPPKTFSADLRVARR